MKRYWVVLGTAGMVAVACGSWLTTCRPAGMCMPAPRVQGWPATFALASGLLVGAMTIGWLVRVVWILWRSAVSFRGTQRAAGPPGLWIAATLAGVHRLECIDDEVPLALCSGGVRPRILVSEVIVNRLSADELVAVLAHEQHHLLRRDPLRRAMLQATVDVLFWVPVVGWWADRRREASELMADRAAIQRAGRPALAGALWKVGSYLEMSGAAAFGGAAELRVAQVLGDALPRQTIPLSVWVGSAAGALFALNSTWCVAHMFGTA